MSTTDLNVPASPEGVPAVLRKAAELMYEQVSELRSAWQDRHVGGDWVRIAKELERCATRIEAFLP